MHYSAYDSPQPQYTPAAELPSEQNVHQFLRQYCQRGYLRRINDNRTFNSDPTRTPFLQMMTTDENGMEDRIVAFNTEIDGFSVYQPNQSFFFYDIQENRNRGGHIVNQYTQMIPYTNGFPRETSLRQFIQSENGFLLNHHLCLIVKVIRVGAVRPSYGGRLGVGLQVCDRNGEMLPIEIFASYPEIGNEYPLNSTIVIFHMILFEGRGGQQYYQAAARDVVLLQ